MVENERKTWFFVSFWEIFFVYPLFHPMSYAPIFCLNILLRYVSMASFISVVFVVVKLKNLKVFRIVSASMKWTLFGGFGLLFLQTLVDLAEILARDSLLIRQTQGLKNCSKVWILAQIERTQSLQFWSILGPNLPPENQKYYLKLKFLQKLHP